MHSLGSAIKCGSLLLVAEIVLCQLGQDQDIDAGVLGTAFCPLAN